MGFAVCAFHHGYCPGFEVDGGAFGGLDEGIGLLDGELASCADVGGERE